jgi:hypothetical protein
MRGDRRIEGVINEPEQTDAQTLEWGSYRQKNIFKILESLFAYGFMFFNFFPYSTALGSTQLPVQ